jgi:hypothetical protein
MLWPWSIWGIFRLSAEPCPQPKQQLTLDFTRCTGSGRRLEPSQACHSNSRHLNHLRHAFCLNSAISARWIDLSICRIELTGESNS